jgi:hypothetical protein
MEGENPLTLIGEDFFYATAAADATVVFDDHALGVIIDYAIDKEVWESGYGDAHFIAEPLKVAVAAFFAGRAEVIAFGVHHFDECFAAVEEFGGMYVDVHTFPDERGTGGYGFTVGMDGANPAGAERRIDVWVIAE